MEDSLSGSARTSSLQQKWDTLGRLYTIRAILLGEAGAGKTNLFHRIKYRAFRDESSDLGGFADATTEKSLTVRGRQYDSYTKTITLSGGTRASVTVFDTANRERVQSLTAQYYRNVNVVLLVFSLDSEYTLNRLAKWYQDARHYIDDPSIVYALVGTKSDLPETEREVTRNMISSFASHYKINQKCVFEVSARTGSCVTTMLRTVTAAVIESNTSPPDLSSSSATDRTPLMWDGNIQDTNDSCCCCCGRTCVIL